MGSVESRVARAIARRRSLLTVADGGETDAFRLIHGEADGLPGLFIDRLGPLLRVLVAGRATEGFRERAIEGLQQQLPVTPEGQAWSVLELLHQRTPSHAAFDSVRWLAGGVDALAAVGARLQGAWLRVEERGLRFWVDPGWDSPHRLRPGFGLFLDQRENRARLAPLAARGGRWLNLFSHTGAFSVSLLAAGAEAVVSVDLSAPYPRPGSTRISLRIWTVVLIRPDISRCVAMGGAISRRSGRARGSPASSSIRRPLRRRAGRRFWSLRQDLEPLLRLCLGRLEAGGVLLVSQNQKGAPLGLDRVLERIASRSHRSIAGLEPAPPGFDHPSLAGFRKETLSRAGCSRSHDCHASARECDEMRVACWPRVSRSRRAVERQEIGARPPVGDASGAQRAKNCTILRPNEPFQAEIHKD